MSPSTRSTLADRLVLALGLAAILCTGFFGADASDLEPAAIPYIRHHDGASAPSPDFP